MTDKKLLAAMRADAAALDWGQAQPLWIAGGGGRGAPTVSIGDNGTGGGGGLSTRREDQAMTDKITIERETLEQFRDDVLHQRGPLAENGMTSDQVNDVLGLFDDAFCAALAAQPAEPVARVVPYGATVKLIWEDTAAAHNCKPGPLYAAPPAPAAVPPGWKLVPIEPTEAMIASGAVALVKASHSDIDPTMEEVTAAYRAMIAAGDKP